MICELVFTELTLDQLRHVFGAVASDQQRPVQGRIFSSNALLVRGLWRQRGLEKVCAGQTRLRRQLGQRLVAQPLMNGFFFSRFRMEAE
jgi:hypothetical protein